MDNAFAAGDRFLLSQARLLERRLFATCFLGQPAARVVDALRGYQNDDGGFGHALEPDVRCPASLPIDVETALAALAAAGTVEPEMVLRACDFLARTAAEAGAGGAVPPAFPVIHHSSRSPTPNMKGAPIPSRKRMVSIPFQMTAIFRSQKAPKQSHPMEGSEAAGHRIRNIE